MYIIHKNLTFKVINVDKFCIEKVMEVYAIILQLTYLNIWIFIHFKSTNGNFKVFHI
jgi:hypothetical protein